MTMNRLETLDKDTRAILAAGVATQALAFVATLANGVTASLEDTLKRPHIPIAANDSYNMGTNFLSAGLLMLRANMFKGGEAVKLHTLIRSLVSDLGDMSDELALSDLKDTFALVDRVQVAVRKIGWDSMIVVPDPDYSEANGPRAVVNLTGNGVATLNVSFNREGRIIVFKSSRTDSRAHGSTTVEPQWSIPTPEGLPNVAAAHWMPFVDACVTRLQVVLDALNEPIPGMVAG